MAEQQYTLTADANGVIPALENISLGFACRSVRIDNPTGSWLYVTQLGKSIAPFTIAWTMALEGTQVGSIKPQAPSGQTNYARAGQTVVIIFSSSPVAADSTGYSIQSPNIQTAVGSMPVLAGPVMNPLTINTTFYIRSIRIDNPTGQWLAITNPALGVFIPPYTVGFSLNINPTLTVTITPQTPAGQISNPIVGQAASVLVSDTPVTAPSGGTPSNVDTMQVATFTPTVAAGVMPNVNAGPFTFFARSITIDNPTGQWFHVPALTAWVPPYLIGWQRNLPSGQLTGLVQAITPSSETSLPLNGQIAVIRYVDTPLTESPGTPVEHVTHVSSAHTMVVAGGVMPALNVNFTLPMRSIRVDNPTGVWLSFALAGGANVFIPPYTINWSFNLNPTLSFNVTPLDPPSGGVSTLINGMTANILFNDDNRPETSGVPVPEVYVSALNTVINTPFPGSQVITPSFTIRSVLVDNNSGQWVFIQPGIVGQSQWIKPYTLGFAINVSATASITVIMTTPNAFVQNTPIAGQNIQVHTFSYALNANAGQPIENPYRLQQLYLSQVAAGVLPNININTATNPTPFVGRSVRIDNPSGCWLFLANPGIRVPPYTLGFAVNTPLTATNTISQLTPPGQISNPINGEAVTAVVSDFSVTESNGVFVQNPNTVAPPNITFKTGQAAVGPGPAVAVAVTYPGVANRLIRLTSYHITIEIGTAGAPTGPCFVEFLDVGSGLVVGSMELQGIPGAGNLAQATYSLANDSGVIQSLTLGGALTIRVNNTTALIAQAFMAANASGFYF